MAETLSCEIEGLKTEGVVKHGPRLCRTKAHQDDARARSRLYKKPRTAFADRVSRGGIAGLRRNMVPVVPSPMVGK